MRATALGPEDEPHEVLQQLGFDFLDESLSLSLTTSANTQPFKPFSNFDVFEVARPEIEKLVEELVR